MRYNVGDFNDWSLRGIDLIQFIPGNCGSDMIYKTLLLGANGQLGRELIATRPPECDLVSCDRHALDICDADAVARVFATEDPAVVINAAAYTGVDKAESEPAQAQAVNADAVENLARGARQAGSRLIHISTDFVFDGNRDRPYLPADQTSGLGVYGRTKLAGERAVLEFAGDLGVVLRTAWLYSAYGHNFVKTMLRLMAERETLNVVDDQRGAPTWARGLAEVIWLLARRPELHGIYHWTDGCEASWYEFAQSISDQARTVGLLQKPVTINPVGTEQYPTPAQRPAYSVLDCSATVSALGVVQQPWPQQLVAMLEELKNRGEPYLE